MRNLIIAAALTAAPGIAVAQSAPAPSSYVAQAGASDLYEKQSSQLVLGSTQDANIRKYANQMIADHNKSTRDVTAAAKKAGVRVAPPKLNAEQSRNMAALRRVNGTERDRLYVEQQRASHQQALALHQGYAQSGTSAPLKTTAGAIAPVVKMHLSEVQAM